MFTQDEINNAIEELKKEIPELLEDAREYNYADTQIDTGERRGVSLSYYRNTWGVLWFCTEEKRRVEYWTDRYYTPEEALKELQEWVIPSSDR